MTRNVNRRQLLKSASCAAASGLMVLPVARGTEAEKIRSQTVAGKAKSCIFIWLGGGACQIDTWDPKQLGDPKQGKKKPGSAYAAIDTAVAGLQICEHLPQMAQRMDRGSVIRSVTHDVIDEHAAATNRMHVGRAPTGTTVYPSIGSVVSHELGRESDEVPSYVVMGYPSATRGPGFLGAAHSYLYLIDTENGPEGLRRPDDVTPDRLDRRTRLLSRMRSEFRRNSDGRQQAADYLDAAAAGDRLAGASFASVFDLKSENPALRETYGGEFGQRCLLARRLVESGVRFTEVSFNLNFINGTGWDTHNEGQANQHLLIRELDQALAALIDDLEARRLLDSTLIVVATEFGRPPEFDGGGGRGHQSRAFSVPVFGGGLAGGQVIGTTDDFGRDVIEQPVTVPDLHATIYASLGIDFAKELFDDDRPIPITDHGQPILRLLGS